MCTELVGDIDVSRLQHVDRPGILAAGAAGIAKVLFYIFIVIFVVLLAMALLGGATIL